MSRRFEELDWQPTPQGEISLRRRYDATAGVDVFEVKLGEEYLMSSLFTVAEEALADLGLAVLQRDGLQVLVGGLGLGYTALAALRDPRVASLTVVETSEPVLDWHRRQLLPDASGLATEERCRLVHDDFFGWARRAPEPAETSYDAVLLDIDHTPRHVLHPSHADFYTVEGLTALRRHLADGGVFGLWSDDPPDAEFEAILGRVFDETAAHVVDFANPITGGTSSNTVYVAR